MKRICCAGLMGAAIASLGAGPQVTEKQWAVREALVVLEFEPILNPRPPLAVPCYLKVTKKTIEHLEKLMKDGKTIEVNGDGTFTIRDPAAPNPAAAKPAAPQKGSSIRVFPTPKQKRG